MFTCISTVSRTDDPANPEISAEKLCSETARGFNGIVGLAGSVVKRVARIVVPGRSRISTASSWAKLGLVLLPTNAVLLSYSISHVKSVALLHTSMA